MEVEILWQLSPLHQIAKTEPCGTAQGGFRSLLSVFLAVGVNIKIEERKDLRMLLSSCEQNVRLRISPNTTVNSSLPRVTESQTTVAQRAQGRGFHQS